MAKLLVRGTNTKREPTENDVISQDGTEIIGSDPDPVVRKNMYDEDGRKHSGEGSEG